MPPIDIRPGDLRIVSDVLRRHLPADVKVWVFGSRASWMTKDSSDLDLALEGEDRIPARSLSALDSAFEDSDLAYAVDIVDINRIGKAFRRIVEQQRVRFPEGAAGSGNTGPLVRLPRGWEHSTLGAACERSGGNIQTGPFGSQLHASDYRPVGIPSIMPQNLGDNRVIEDGIARIGEGDATRLARYLVRTGDIVYSRRGDVERRALIGPHEDGWLCGTGCLRIRLGENGVDPRYASYYLGHPVVREWIVRHAHGATMPNLNTAILSACPLLIPPASEQRVIADVLSTLDDKIELNRRMNDTLEAMARALFRSWFVDFDPVRAKMEGRDTGLPKDIADLFPDRLVDSEVGEIPEGWPLVPLPELIEVNPPRSLRRGESAPYLEMANMPTLGHAPDSVDRRPFGSGMRFANGDTLVARITPCLENGKTAYVDFLRDDEIGWGSTEYIVMKPRHPLPSEFAYLLARTARFREFAIQNMSGTSGRQRVPTSALWGFSIPSPPEPIGMAVGRAAQLFLGRARAAVDECRVLANCRDALLPKLVSGEWRVTVQEPAFNRPTGAGERASSTRGFDSHQS